MPRTWSPPDSVTCLRNGCDAAVCYSPRQPGIYCSGACRLAAAREQAWLRKELGRVIDELATHHGSSVRVRQLRSERRRLLWQYRHYAAALIDDEALLSTVMERLPRGLPRRDPEPGATR